MLHRYIERIVEPEAEEPGGSDRASMYRGTFKQTLGGVGKKAGLGDGVGDAVRQHRRVRRNVRSARDTRSNRAPLQANHGPQLLARGTGPGVLVAGRNWVQVDELLISGPVQLPPTVAGEIITEVVRVPGYCGAVTTQVIVLNGGSSSGKSGIARCLQAVLPEPWLTLGVDTLIRAMPLSPRRSVAEIDFASDGAIIIGPRFRALEAAWIEGVAAMAHAGARIIVDEVFLGGAASQQRWKTALGALPVLWVGVRCDSAVAVGREIARGDRVAGQAASQAERGPPRCRL